MLVEGIVEETKSPHVLVATQDLHRAIHGAVVGHNGEVHSLSEVVVEIGGDDLFLVANQKGHHQFHGLLA
jgi:hypothetical protein